MVKEKFCEIRYDLIKSDISTYGYPWLSLFAR